MNDIIRSSTPTKCVGNQKYLKQNELERLKTMHKHINQNTVIADTRDCQFARVQMPNPNPEATPKIVEIIGVRPRFDEKEFYPWTILRGEQYLPCNKRRASETFTRLFEAHEAAEKMNISLREYLKQNPNWNKRTRKAKEETVEEESTIMTVEEVAEKMGVSVGQIALFKAIINETSFEYDEDTNDGYIDDRSLNPLIASKSNGGYLTQLKKNNFLTMIREHINHDENGYWVTVNEKGKEAAEMLGLYVG